MNLVLQPCATLDEETGEVTLVFTEQWDETMPGGPVDYVSTKRVTVTLSPATVEDITPL